jgi:eukaryotic-like serine/threonine-protein kinase
MNAFPQVGDLLDHYRLDRLAAIGGTSAVFRATDTRTGAPVAVKVPHVQKHSAIRRWLFPADHTISGLHHPGLVHIFAVVNEPRSYVVMEWVEGRLLREFINGSERSIERSIEIALKICNVLAEIHARGFVHLDLKPENIMVDRWDEVKLIDFEPARGIRTGLLNLIRSKKMGTPDYASPEQIRGKTAGPASDLYSLGLIFYEMLTGEVPFSGMNQDISMNLRLRNDAPPPNELNPEISPALNDLVCQTIARDPKKRPSSARVLYEQLAHIKEDCVRDLVPALQ